MTTSETSPLPSIAQLIRAIGIAVVVAMIILITAVLPAEYGIDRVIKEIDKNMKELEEDKPAIPPLSISAPKELE